MDTINVFSFVKKKSDSMLDEIVQSYFITIFLLRLHNFTFCRNDLENFSFSSDSDETEVIWADFQFGCANIETNDERRVQLRKKNQRHTTDKMGEINWKSDCHHCMERPIRRMGPDKWWGKMYKLTHTHAYGEIDACILEPGMAYLLVQRQRRVHIYVAIEMHEINRFFLSAFQINLELV